MSDAEPGAPVGFGNGAALGAGSTAWILVDGDASSAVGPALAWARGQRLDDLVLIVDEGAAVAARRAAYFSPPPAVVVVVDDSLQSVEPAPPVIEPAPPDVPRQAKLLADAGLDVHVEHGRILGEYLGLEVARISADGREPLLEVGVGKYDRELTAMVHQDLPTPEALERVVEIVGRHRRADGPQHPLRDLAPERWLRQHLIDEPGLVGCAELSAAPSPFARSNLRERATAAATGTDEHNGPVVVVTSVGIDLDLVPTAADTRAHLAPDARLLVAVPERDQHPLTTYLAGRLSRCEVAAVTGDWRA